MLAVVRACLDRTLPPSIFVKCLGSQEDFYRVIDEFSSCWLVVVPFLSPCFLNIAIFFLGEVDWEL